MKRQPPILITSSFLLPTDALMLAVVSDFGDITIPGLLYVQYSMGKPIKMRAADAPSPGSLLWIFGELLDG